MMTEDISICFTPEFGTEQIIARAANLDVPYPRSTPDTVQGRFTGTTEGEIVQFELRLSPVRVIFRGKKYHFDALKRTGEFTLQKAW